MIRIRKREGHYTVKIVERLPKKGNSNWLYALRGTEGETIITEVYEWNPFTIEFETILIGDSSLVIQAGMNITITGTGSDTDPLIINAVGEENVQSDWDQLTMTEDNYILNKPENTSDFNNDGADGVNPFITANDINTSEVTNTVVGNTIAQHDNGDGTIVDINETVTSLDINGNDLEYTDENGDVNTIPLALSETLTSLTDNSDGTVTYTDELGNPTVISKSSIIDNLDGTYTFSNNNGSDITIDTNSTPIINTSELVNDGSDGTSVYVEDDEIVEVARTGLSVRDKNNVEQFKSDEFIQCDSIIFDIPNKLIKPATPWTFNETKFNTSGISVGNWHGLRTLITTPVFSIDTGSSTLTGSAATTATAFMAQAPKDCYLSMVQIAANFSGAANEFGLVIEEPLGSTQVIFQSVVTQRFIQNFDFISGTTIVIPEGSVVFPFLKVGSTGIFGSFAFTLTEI